MFKKGKNIFSLLIIIVSVLMTSSINIANADSGTSISDTCIKKAELQNSEGKQMTSFNLNDDMQAFWHFKIPSATHINEGDSMTVNIPKQLTVNSNPTFQIEDSKSTDSPKPIIANGKVNPKTSTTPATVTLTFTDYAAKKSKTGIVEGDFKVGVKWSQTDIKTDVETPIEWITDGTADQNIINNVTVKPAPPSSTEVFYKFGGFDQTDPSIIRWTARINYRKDDLNDVVYKDTIGNNQTLVKDSLKAYKVNYEENSSNYTKIDGSDFPNTIFTTDDNGFSATLGDIGTDTILIDYNTEITNPDSKSESYGNTGDLQSNNKTIKYVPVNLATNTASGSGSTQDDITSVIGQKTWDKDNDGKNNTRPKEITVNLFSKSKDPSAKDKLIKSQKVTAENNWSYSFYNLAKYDSSGNKINYYITEDSVNNYDTSIDGYNITNTYNPKSNVDKKSLTVTKSWANDNDNKESTRKPVHVQLYSGQTPVGDKIELNDSNNWTYKWNDLDDSNNTTYTVKELDSPKDYSSETKYDSDGNATITNTYTHNGGGGDNESYRDLTVNKHWSDSNDKDGIRPDKVVIQLYANGEKHGDPITLNSENDWSHKFTNLAKKDDNDKDIIYTIKEDKVTGYDTNIDNTSDNNIVITNTHTPGNPPTPTDIKSNLTVKKIWLDNNNQDGIRPDKIQVQLLANGQKSGDPITLNQDNDWLYTWNNLDKNTDYTVEEVGQIYGYSSNVDKLDSNNFVITNTHTPGTNNPGNGTGNPGSTDNTDNGYDRSDRLPQTGTKSLGWIYTTIGLLIIVTLSSYLITKKKY